MFSHRRLFITRVFAVCLPFFIAALGRAATLEWFNSAGGSFSTATNWAPGAVPSSTDTALFDLPITYTVTFSTSPFITAVNQTNGFVTLNLGTRTLTASSTTNNAAGAAGLTSTLDIQNGIFKPGNFTLAAVSNSTSNLILDIGSTTTIGSGPFYIGTLGTGNLTVLNAATLITTGTTAIGLNASSVGTATVSGPASSWTANNTLRVGSVGTGTLNIQSGGSVTAPSLEVGEALGSTGTINLTGNQATFSTPGTANIGGSTATLVALSATVNIGTGSTMTLGGTTNLRTNARVNMLGGTLNLNTINVTAGAQINWSAGTINFATAPAITSSLLDTLLTSTHTLGTGRTLSATAGTFSLNSPLSLTGGNISVPTLDLSANLKIGAFSNAAATGTVTLEPGTTTEISDFGSLGATTGITNNGGTLLLDGSLANVTGLVTNNTGYIRGTGRFTAGLNNGAAGIIRAETGDDLLIDTTGPTNLGTIELAGGTVEYSKTLTNLAGGTISGRGIFRGSAAAPGGPGLTNQGILSFSAGLTDIYGDVNNTGIIVDGGGSTVTYYDDMVNNGFEIRTVTGSRSVFFGDVSGSGPFTGGGVVELDGDLKPGNSPANVSFGGNVVIGPTAATDIELAGTEKGSHYDSLTVAGNVSLSGKLNLLLIDGFVPAAGESFNIMSAAGGIDGTFSSMNLPALAGGLYFAVAYTPNAVNVSVAGVVGDFNHDGKVDAADYAFWRKNIGETGQGLAADGNGDGVVNSDDFNVWRSHFGQSVGSGAVVTGSAVPEPGIVALAMISLLVAQIKRRR
ncbi:MAG TPA: dockerin type I domain-containing protein [Lacipirellulaceae bacterium]|jgi:T5SS/PEP-CTERM-associated repeat protein|nr:dockerin type I domain-containing protein [Lacipirellulaceae bacterium]